MNEILTMKEIEERYDSEWVLLEDPVSNKRDQILSGKLLCHSRDRMDIHYKARELRPKHAAILYIGKGPEGMLYCY